MKRIVSLLLCVLMVFSLSLPAFAAAEPEEYPTVYVTGAQTNDIYSAEGERIWDLDVDAMAVVKQAIKPCLEELLTGMASRDYKAYAETVNSYVAPIFEKVVLDKNGEASNGSHPANHSSSVEVEEKYSGYGIWDYRFWYDWRLSPIVTAEELKDYIDRVTEATGKEKVQLVGRCYGANVIQTYITLYKDHALENVSDISYFASSVMGIDYMSALFSGEVVLDDKAVSNFVQYFLEDEELIEDDVLSGFVYALIEVFRYAEVLGIGTDTLLLLFDEIKYDLIPTLLPNIIGSWASYWSMVTADKYEEAIEFIYGDRKDEYAGLIEKTDRYHYEVQLCAEETILELQDKGINFYIFSKYGFPDMPLYDGAANESDSTTSVPRQSFGAECSDFGETFSDEYINSLSDTTYLSPDYKINAASALIPERSWFVKGLHHDWFGELHDMTLEIMRYDMTVHNEKYPQYLLRVNSDTLVPVTESDDDYVKSTQGIVGAAIRLLTAFIRVLTNIINGKLSLDLSGLIG